MSGPVLSGSYLGTRREETWQKSRGEEEDRREESL